MSIDNDNRLKLSVSVMLFYLSVVITSRTSRPSSYSRFKYPVKFHWSERRLPLTCDVPDCLRRPSSSIYWMMPVRQGPRRPAVRPPSPPGASGRTESLPTGLQHDQEAPESSPTVVIVVEDVESNEEELSGQKVEVETEEAVETSQDQLDDVEHQYDDEEFEEDTGERADDDNDGETSDKEQDSAQEDHSVYTDHTFDDDYDDYYYAGDEEAVRRRTDLVFHGLEEGLYNKTDKQLVEWVLETGMRLDPAQYIEEVERFGGQVDDPSRVRPIRVKTETVEKRNYILYRQKTLRRQSEFRTRRIYIQPFLTRRQQEIAKELREVLRDFRNKGYENLTIVRDKIVERGRPHRVLYTAET